MITRTRLADGAVVVAAVLAGGASFLGAFPPVPLLLTVATATLVPAALEVFGGRAGRVLVAIAGTAALYVLLRGSVLDLLGMTLPAPATPGLLAVPAGLCCLATALGLETARHARWTPSLGALPASLPIWAVSGLLARYGGFCPWPALLAGVCVATQLARHFSGGAAWRAAGGLVAVAVVAGVAVPWLSTRPVRRKVDPRALVPAVALPPAPAGPLDWVDAWLTKPGETLFRTHTSAPVRYWRWAVLTSYDGVRWRPAERYARAGLGVPPARPESGSVRQSVTIDRLPGPFLPAADRPVRVADPVGGVDVDTGVLIARRTVGSGFRYEVSSRPVTPALDVPCGPAGPPDVPPELAGPLRTLIGPGCAGSFAAFAADVQRRLNTGRTNVAGAPATGTSVGVLKDFLTGGRRGTVVEFDSAYALALRAAGIPARVVVGFEPADAGRVTGSDVRLWIEARLPGPGWIDVHPTFPKARPAPDRPPAAAVPQPTFAAPPPPSATPRPMPTEVRPAGSTGHLRRMVLLGTAAAAGYLLLVLLVPIGRRWVRRRRGRPRDRAVAAWHDVLDELAFSVAVARLRSATPAATRQLARAAPGDLAAVVRAAEGALFAPDPPGETDIREAWRAATRVRRRLRRRPGRLRRIGRAVSWRNLRPRSAWW